jgi:excisionase family DNA binding protein
MRNVPRDLEGTFAILTVRDMAEYLRLSQAKRYRLTRERSLPVFRIGKSWRFREDLLDVWLVRQLTMSAARVFVA